jgi:hypothetical protein
MFLIIFSFFCLIHLIETRKGLAVGGVNPSGIISQAVFLPLVLYSLLLLPYYDEGDEKINIINFI